jgi:RimJ/RimL family protein N-acetyltransferase
VQTEFHDGSVGIRPFRAEDVPALFAAARESIQELSTWMVWCHAGYSLEDSARFITQCEAGWKKGEQYSFAIFDAGTGTFLGSIGLSGVSHTHKVANLGYWVRTKKTQQGVASVATRLITRFALEEVGLNRLELFVPVGNKASQRVAEKAGARWEGLLRKRLMLSSGPQDAVLYSLVAEEPELVPWQDREENAARLELAMMMAKATGETRAPVRLNKAG